MYIFVIYRILSENVSKTSFSCLYISIFLKYPIIMFTKYQELYDQIPMLAHPKQVNYSPNPWD